MARDDDRIIPLYDFRIEDLRQWHIVEATCFHCRRTEVVRHEHLQRADDPFVRLVRIKSRLRCRACGNRDGNSLSVKMAPRN